MENVNIPQIGPVVQRLRKSRGLTLQQLAAISGVSKSILSQIERGQANPTFAVLWSLTRALKMEFADLLEGGSIPSHVDTIEIVTASQTPEIRARGAGCRLRILSPPQLASVMEWYQIEIDPSGELKSAPHAFGTVEHFTAVTGRFRVASGNTTRIVKAGETGRYRADAPHCIANDSKKVAMGFLIVRYR